MHQHYWYAAASMLVSALFYVIGKVAMARHKMPWDSLWFWSLSTTGLCGLIAWLALGAPAVPWGWCLAAALCGTTAHIGSNLALAWGDASLLVPITGAKPLALLVLLPLVGNAALPPTLIHASWLATLGVALTGLSPRRVHVNAPRPGAAFLIMSASVVLMASSDLCGKQALAAAGPEGRWATIAVWNLFMATLPLLSLARWRRQESPANIARAAVVGVIFASYIVLLSLAIALAPDPALAVAEANVVIACRGIAAVLMVMALDRWLKLGLEPVPWYIQGIRLLGAVVLAAAVALAYFG